MSGLLTGRSPTDPGADSRSADDARGGVWTEVSVIHAQPDAPPGFDASGGPCPAPDPHENAAFRAAVESILAHPSFKLKLSTPAID
jgi:hypothetical protein